MTSFIFSVKLHENERFLLEDPMEKPIDEVIAEETSLRLQEISAKDYAFPKKADKMDIAAISLLVTICTLLILLCMTGVIV